MFKFTVESSTPIKKLTIEFGEGGSTVDVGSEYPESSSSTLPTTTKHAPSTEDLIASRLANPTTQSSKSVDQNSSELVVEPIGDRPAKVDEGFAGATF